MKIDVLDLEKVVQLRVADQDMSLFSKLERGLNNHLGVQLIKKTMTFETPIVDYKYKGVDFALLFDEQEGETFLAVLKPLEHTEIEQLLRALVIAPAR